MKISVTQEHIDQGKKNDNRACPIALAINDATKTNSASVGWFSCSFHTHLGRVTRSLPVQASRFIDYFDGGNSVSPFEFEV